MSTDPQGSGSAGSVTLKERYEIDPAQRLPELDMPQAAAYHCEDRRGAGRSLYALLCQPDMPLRVGAMRSLKGIQTPGLLTLVEYGIIDWTPDGRRQMAVVYERPSGGRVLAKPGQKFDAIPESQFVKRVMKPIIQFFAKSRARISAYERTCFFCIMTTAKADPKPSSVTRTSR